MLVLKCVFSQMPREHTFVNTQFQTLFRENFPLCAKFMGALKKSVFNIKRF